MVVEVLVTRRPRPYLTGREAECVALLAEGLAPKEIAARLGISYWTVQSHLGNARRRCRVSTNVQLALVASRRRTRSAA